MKKILFILGMYAPDYSANGLCTKNVVDEFVKEGYEVHCVVNAYGEHKEDYCLDGAIIHPVKMRRLQEKLLYCRTNPKKYGRFKSLYLFLNKVKSFLMSPFWPLISPAYTNRFFKKAKKLHKELNFDVVVGVYTPIDSVYAAHKLKKCAPEIKFVPYFLDALAGGHGPSKWSKDKIKKRLSKWEKKITSNADLIVSMKSSEEFHEKNNQKRVYLDVPMMLDVFENLTEKKDIDKHLAVFAGNIPFPNRNPIPLMDVFIELQKMLDIDLVFVGDCNNLKMCEEYTNKTNGKIKFVGQQKINVVYEYEGKADFLVNIGTENPYTIQCKIFEYMRFRKPIISTYKIDNEPSKPYLNKYENVYFIDENQDPKEVAKKMLPFIKNQQVVDKDNGFFQKEFYNNTPKAFVDAIEKL